MSTPWPGVPFMNTRQDVHGTGSSTEGKEVQKRETSRSPAGLRDYQGKVPDSESPATSDKPCVMSPNTARERPRGANGAV